ISEPTPLIIDPVIVDETCAGVCNGQISWSGQGGTAPYSYVLGGSPSSGAEIALCDGDYDLSVTDDNGCQTDVTVTVNPGEEVRIDDVLVINDGCTDVCDGSVAVLATGAVHYTLDADN